MGEYNGGAKKRVLSLTEKLHAIREEHHASLRAEMTGYFADNCGRRVDELEDYFRAGCDAIAKRWVQQLAGAIAKACIDEHEQREAKRAAAKQQARIDMFHRPGRFGHG